MLVMKSTVPPGRIWKTHWRKHHFPLGFVDNSAVSQSELPQRVPVSLVRLAFRDFERKCGSQEIGTPWELHPAEVTVKPSGGNYAMVFLPATSFKKLITHELQAKKRNRNALN